MYTLWWNLASVPKAINTVIIRIIGVLNCKNVSHRRNTIFPIKFRMCNCLSKNASWNHHTYITHTHIYIYIVFLLLMSKVNSIT